MSKFLNFDKMLTPTLIKIIFFISVIASIIFGLIMIVTGASNDFGGGAQVLVGVLVLILGPLFTRVYCELLIVMFKINENLQHIKDNNK